MKKSNVLAAVVALTAGMAFADPSIKRECDADVGLGKVGSPVSSGVEEPLFRIGWISDTHTGSTRADFDGVTKAMKLFRERKVDAVIHNGDISAHYDPAGYALYRQVMDEAFAGAEKKPVEIYAWAWHDILGWNRPGGYRSQAERRTASFADVAKKLGIRHRMTDRFEIGGHVFVLSPQFLDDVAWKGKKGLAAYELLLQEAERDSGGRPVFVIDHVPPARTVEGSANCDEWKRTLYAKHPGIISLSGHTHGTLRDETKIWQGEFTAVNAATLHLWDGDLIGCTAPAKRGYCASVIEGFGDRVVFRRFDVRDGEEIAPENPWTVPWPFDPKTAPYSPERRAKTAPVPLFAADARVSVRMSESSGDLTLVMPPLVAGADSAYRYSVSVAEKTADGWRRFKTIEMYTQFHLRPSERQKEELMLLSAGYFEAGRRYRFEVTPVNFFGVAGKPAYGEAIAPGSKSAKLLWACANPMGELKFVYGDDGTDGGKPVETEDGWYRRELGTKARLVVPAEAWRAPAGTKIRFTVDMETVQDPDASTQTYCLSLMRYSPTVETTSTRVKTPHGASGVQRYILEFTKGKDVPYNLFVFHGTEGKIRFHAVKVERLDP